MAGDQVQRRLKMREEKVTITGIVIPVDWDRHGNAVAVSIVASSFEKYIVKDDEKVNELLKLADQFVRVEALVTGEDIFNNKIIEVNQYELLGQ